jgi:hypothetical protein
MMTLWITDFDGIVFSDLFQGLALSQPQISLSPRSPMKGGSVALFGGSVEPKLLVIQIVLIAKIIFCQRG